MVDIITKIITVSTKICFFSNLLKGLIIGLVIIGFASCKKFVTIDTPVNQLVTQSVFTNNATATAAQTSIYSQWSNNTVLYTLLLATGSSGDELFNYSTDLGVLGYYTNAIAPINERANDVWTPAYSYIYQANAIISGLKNNSAINARIAQQLTGESEFIRAYWHFYLTNLFGDIPLVTTTDYTVNGTISRTPQAEVYKQIIADLLDAQGKLNVNFVNGSDTAITTERTRPTSWAATALLARVYLYQGDYQNAYVQANKVIGNTALFNLATSLGQVFVKNSNEAIFQLQAVSTSYDTQEGYYFILTTTPGIGMNNCSTISPKLLSSFEPNDARKSNWIGSVKVGANTYTYPNKYKIRTQSTAEYSTLLRLAEQYLIRAEAQANGAGNGISGAISDMNVIRQRASLLTYAGATDQASVMNAILHERQVEFFTEGGHRWFDLKRTGTLNSVMGSPGNVCASKGGTWSPNAALYAIPQTERNNDPNLSQNTGY